MDAPKLIALWLLAMALCEIFAGIRLSRWVGRVGASDERDCPVAELTL